MEFEYFGKNILYLRQREGQTLTEFGEQFGLSNSQISYYEKGHGFPPIKVAMKMSAKFDCTLDDLFMRDMRPNSPFSPDDKPRDRIRKPHAPPQYGVGSVGQLSLVSAATESPPTESDVGIRATESPPPKETEIVKDVGKKREEIPILRRQVINIMQRLEELERTNA